MKFMLCSGSTRWVARKFPPNLWAIFVAKKTEVIALSATLPAEHRHDGRDWELQKKKSGETQINTFHLKWQASGPDVFLKTLSRGAEVLTFGQLRREVSGCRSSRVIISWPCLLDGPPPYFTANKLAVALMMSSSDDQPTTAAAPPLSKEAPVHSNEVCNDCNVTQDGKFNLFELAKCNLVSGVYQSEFDSFRCLD